MVSGAFPFRRADGVLIEPVGHIVGAFMAFLGAGIGLMVLSRRMASDRRWRSVAVYAPASGIAIVVGFFMYGGLARAPDAPLSPWGGIVQRAPVAVWFTCTIVLALRLLRVARGTS